MEVLEPTTVFEVPDWAACARASGAAMRARASRPGEATLAMCAILLLLILIDVTCILSVVGRRVLAGRDWLAIEQSLP